MSTPASHPRLPALLIGIGMGGFVDGIVIHQVLQWHHMLSHTDDNPMTTVAGLEGNTLADGFFHLGTWIVTFMGVNLAVKAWQAGRLAPPWRMHLGRRTPRVPSHRSRSRGEPDRVHPLGVTTPIVWLILIARFGQPVRRDTQERRT